MNTRTKENGLRRKAAAFVLGGALLVTSAFGLAAANGSNTATASTPPAAAAQQAPTTAKTAATVPKPLENAGHHGEGVYDAVKLGDWKKAGTELASLKDATAQLRSTRGVGDTARINSDVAALEHAVAAKNEQAALLASNRVTLDAANLSASYKTPVPVEVTKLDYYGRQLEIQAAANDTAGLKQTTLEIQKTWDKVRPQVIASGGSVEAKQFDATVAKLQQAKSPDQYGKLAGPVLSQVDLLEKAFA